MHEMNKYAFYSARHSLVEYNDISIFANNLGPRVLETDSSLYLRSISTHFYQ